jgi:putative transposase
VKFAAIQASLGEFPTTLMCRSLNVSRAGFYAWQRRGPSQRELHDEAMLVDIEASFAANRKRYGSPRIHEDLKEIGWRTSRKRVARLMRQNGLRARKKSRFCKTTDSNHELAVAPNVLDRRFDSDARDRAWVTDITYIPTGEGWLYLSVILDLFSRRVVGWSMASHMRTEFPLQALEMALRSRRPPLGLIHHSDRGSQYASGDYRRALRENGIECSMSRRRDCWDNAVAESFFATLKKELVYEARWETRVEAELAIFSYIEGYYNRTRRHSSLGYISPVEFERRNELELAA